MTSRLLSVAALLLLTSPLLSSAQAGKSTDFGTEYERDEYSVGASAMGGTVGEKSHVVVTVTARNGYRIDRDFAHSARAISASGDAQWGRQDFDADDAKLSDDGRVLTFQLPWRATRIGEYKVKAKVTTRVCDGEDCKRVNRSIKTRVYAR